MVEHVDSDGRVWRSIPFDTKPDALHLLRQFRLKDSGPSCVLREFVEHPDGYWLDAQPGDL